MLHGRGVTFISWRMECLLKYLKTIANSRERLVFWLMMGSAARLGVGADIYVVLLFSDDCNALRLILVGVLFQGKVMICCMSPFSYAFVCPNFSTTTFHHVHVVG